MKTASVFNVANYILQRCGEMTTMKLQKLCYYCQAWSLAWDDRPLFDEEFEAWANGPVCRNLYNRHKHSFTLGKNYFEKYKYDFSDEQIETMEAVIKGYAGRDPLELSALTHSERPWQETRRNNGAQPGDRCIAIIPKELMQEYYGGL